MDTLKNFLLGLFVVTMSLIIFGLILLTWPFILGLGSIMLSIIAVILFILLLFYIIVFVGHLTKQFIKKK